MTDQNFLLKYIAEIFSSRYILSIRSAKNFFYRLLLFRVDRIMANFHNDWNGNFIPWIPFEVRHNVNSMNHPKWDYLVHTPSASNSPVNFEISSNNADYPQQPQFYVYQNPSPIVHEQPPAVHPNSEPILWYLMPSASSYPYTAPSPSDGSTTSGTSFGLNGYQHEANEYRIDRNHPHEMQSPIELPSPDPPQSHPSPMEQQWPRCAQEEQNIRFDSRTPELPTDSVRPTFRFNHFAMPTVDVSRMQQPTAQQQNSNINKRQLESPFTAQSDETEYLPQNSHQPSVILENPSTNVVTEGENSRKKKAKIEPISKKCSVCNRTFSKYRYMIQHMSLVHLSGEVRCKICGKHFPSEADRDKHSKRHLEKEKQFLCDQCPQLFNYNADLKRHFAKNHTNSASHPCTICPAKFYRSDQLMKHFLSHEKGTTKKIKQQ